MVYSRISQQSEVHTSSNPEEERLTPSDRLANTFDSDSDSEDEGWVDDRETSAVGSSASEMPGSSSETENSRRVPWTNIFSRLRKSKDESGHGNGVFGNLVAKGQEDDLDDGEHTSNEKPPSYEEAAADATPSYWETTIMASDWADEVLVGDMPVGSPMHFAWNMLVSAMFSFLGFFVSYLFHTTHAARGGALAGLGCTLIQSSYSFDISAPAPSSPPDEFTPDDPNNYDGTMTSGMMHHPQNMDNSDCGDGSGNAGGALHQTPWVSNLMFGIGCFLILRGLGEYVHALFIKNRILRYNAEQQQQQQQQQPSAEGEPPNTVEV